MLFLPNYVSNLPVSAKLHSKHFSTSQIRRADPLTTATSVMLPLDPASCLALALIANSIVILLGLYGISRTWSVTGIAEYLEPESLSEVENWVTALSAFESLVQNLAQSIRALQEITPTILPNSTIIVQSQLIGGVTAMHQLLEDTFEVAGAFSGDVERASERLPELINLADTFEYELWPDLRVTGNELAEFLRWVENTLHIIPSDRSPLEWFEN